ncbi:MAG: hypothetical protein WBG19_02690 [Thermoplasmata archaeon]
MKEYVTWMRGGLAAAAGFALFGIGLVTGLVGQQIGSSAVLSNLEHSGLPVGPSALGMVWGILILGIVFMALGAALVLYSQPYRKREDDDLRDPMLYPPTRRRRWFGVLLSSAVVVIAATAVLGLYSLPVSHPMGVSFSVGVCGSAYEAHGVSLPAFSEVSLHWKASDEYPIGLVFLPGAPSTGRVLAGGGNDTIYGAYNSSGGTAWLLVGRGGLLNVTACDYPGSPALASGQLVEITGTYYSSIL